MAEGDLIACEDVFHRSLGALREKLGLPRHPGSALFGATAHLLRTDPEGSWVAVDEQGKLIGFTQAAVREDLWVLAHLFVAPEAQGGGVGRLLLRRGCGYGAAAPGGLIASTPDPRAIVAYGRLAGFALHPVLTATGRLARSRLAGVSGVREGTRGDLDFAADLDRAVRGGPHGPDLECLLAGGACLLVVPGQGYAIAGEGGPLIVAARDEGTAVSLLQECLARSTDEEVTIKRMGAAQQWAMRVAIELGLEPRPWGPLLTRASPAATSAYLPDSAFC
jgi:GNAT superfamily N-acetyltransferase